MKKRLFEVIGMLLAIILYFTPHYIAPICSKLKPDGSPMGCFHSANLTMKLAIFIFIVNLIMFLVAKYSFGKYIRIIGSIINIVIAALVYMIPHGILEVHNEVGKPYGFCSSPKMGCVIHNTFGITGIIAGIIAVIMVLNLIYLFLKRDN